MSIATELSRIRDAKDAIRAAIIDKGVNVPAAAKIDTYADRIDEIVQTASGNMEVVTANPSGTINAVDNRFYMLSGDAAALVFNLPAMQQGGYGIYLLMTTASTSVVTFSSADSSQIVFPSGFQVEADKCYLMEFDYVNSQWQVSVEEWFVNGGGGDLPANLKSWKYNDWGLLTEITTADSVTSIGNGAFEYCSSLTSASMPNVTSIGQYGFRNCSSLASVSMPKIVSLDDNCFAACGLENVVLPDTATTFSMNIFAYCDKLKTVTLPSSLTNIYNNMFYGCKLLETITIPASVTIIDNGAFNGCEILNNVILPDNLTSLSYQCFVNCKSLETINIPSSVTSVGQQAFQSCIRLIPTFYGTTPPTFGINVFENYNLPIFVNADAVDAYKTTTNLARYANRIKPIGWTPSVEEGYKAELWFNSGTNATNDFKKIVDDETGTITQSEVRGTGQAYYYLSYVILSDNITSIGDNAFNQCKNISFIDLSNITSIGQQAFRDVELIKSVDLSNVTSIGYYAFNGCKSLKSVNMPNVISIDSNAFYSCSSLASIDLPNTLTSIGQEAFSSCVSLTKINLSNTQITSIPKQMCYYDTSLEIVDLPATVTTFYGTCFGNCTSLKTFICRATTPPTFSGYNYFLNASKTYILYVPDESVDAYKNYTYIFGIPRDNVKPLSDYVPEP